MENYLSGLGGSGGGGDSSSATATAGHTFNTSSGISSDTVALIGLSLLVVVAMFAARN